VREEGGAPPASAGWLVRNLKVTRAGVDAYGRAGHKGRGGEDETTGERGNEGVTGRDRVKQSGKDRRRRSERG
ncbi:hypothetical protein K0M31_002889, partial [Melipona bicolor]